jgi:hypothetical protein
MSGSHGNWDDLSSGNERLVPPPVPQACFRQASASKSAAQWAELGSQGERLADPSLVAQAGRGSRSASLRLVATAA